jgi:cysteine sulfinate desulfinase/cysteine desulfurase-like protein
MKRPIYLDYAATTPVDPQVAERMMECLTFDGTSVTQHRVHMLTGGKQKKK